MKDLFIEIFKLFTSLGGKIGSGDGLENPDFLDYYVAYFQDSAICSSIFYVGLVVALVSAIVFYYIICNKFYSLAKRYVWCVFLVIVGGITFALSYSNIVGLDNDEPEKSTGVFKSAYDKETELLGGTDDEEARDEIMTIASDYRAQFKCADDSIFTEESLPVEMSVTNGVISAILFFLFSFLITHVGALRKLTTHGSGIPF
jgi:hypothetical protein